MIPLVEPVHIEISFSTCNVPLVLRLLACVTTSAAAAKGDHVMDGCRWTNLELPDSHQDIVDDQHTPKVHG